VGQSPIDLAPLRFLHYLAGQSPIDPVPLRFPATLRFLEYHLVTPGTRDVLSIPFGPCTLVLLAHLLLRRIPQDQLALVPLGTHVLSRGGYIVVYRSDAYKSFPLYL